MNRSRLTKLFWRSDKPFCSGVKLSKIIRESSRALRSASGFSLVELLVAISLFALILPSLYAGFMVSREGKPQQAQRVEAATYLTEMVEAVRVVRERGWEDFAQNGVFHPVINGSTWELVTGSQVINGYTRQLQVSDVYRDSSGTIVQSGGILDPSSKKVDILVSWSTPFPSTIESTLYITRYLDNLSYSYETMEDFLQTGHQKEYVEVVADGGGSISLAPGGTGRGDWCQPSIVGELDLPRQGQARAVSAIPFEVFAGTGANASGVSLAYVTVSNSLPPVPALQGSFDGYKTNDIFGEPGYAYLGTDNNAKEVVIVNTATMQEVGYYNIPGPAQGHSVVVSGNVGYVIYNNMLYLFNTTSKIGDRPQLGSIQLAGNATSVYVVGTTAYVSIDSTSNQLQIINVANPALPIIVASRTVNGLGGKDVYISPDERRAYLVTAASASHNEFFLINIENKAAPTVISSYDTTGMDPRAVEMVLSGNRAIIVGTGGEEYQVVNIAFEDNPVRCGGLNEDSGIYDIAAVVEPDGDAYAYITTGQSSSELKIIEGGPGNSFNVNGWYQSHFFDAGVTTAFNRFAVVTSLPEGTELRYRVAIADAVNDSCQGANYVFVGPDSTPDTFYTGNGAFPFDNDGVGYENPGRCFKYRAYFLTDDMLITPVLYEFTVNYSP
jgi:prepilin-type N-terminal cleavage/methylation domain-containing protein